MKSFFRILFAPVLWLLQACSPLGEPVDEETSKNHYYNKSKTDIIYSPMGNWFELGKTPMQVDMESFKVLNGLISKDKSNIYYEAVPVDGRELDIENFYTRGNLYMENLGFEKNMVYRFQRIIQNKEYKAVVYSVDGADPDTFEQLDFDWGKDASHHFYRYNLLEVDYDSFKKLNSYFSLDKDRAYYHFNNHFKAFPADPDTFKVLEDSNYAYDKDKVYCYSLFVDEKEINELKAIPYEENDEILLYNTNYLRCGNKVLYAGFELPKANAREFEPITEFYGKDKSHVFHENKIVSGADPETFHLSTERYGVYDKNGQYVKGELVVGEEKQSK